MTGADAERPPIPGRLNLLLATAAGVGACGLLALASRPPGWGAPAWAWRGAAALLFSYLGNTLFSLLHEAVHGSFHPRREVNEWAGRLLAVAFPTGFTFQRICHLGHHRRNRSDQELFDYVLPGESHLLKSLQWYGLLTGIYWLAAPLGCLAFLLVPNLARLPGLRPMSRLGRQTSAVAMLSGFEGAPAARIRLEILLSLALQLAVFRFLHLTLGGWLLCYGAFAVNWSSLQYADHAWSERDVRDGAWNLRVNPVVRALFLNYHHHLAHHQHPQVPWTHLPRYVDPATPRPSFLRIYLSMWRGPRRWPPGEGREGAADPAGHRGSARA